jgi:hypothetical protein
VLLTLHDLFDEAVARDAESVNGCTGQFGMFLFPPLTRIRDAHTPVSVPTPLPRR